MIVCAICIVRKDNSPVFIKVFQTLEEEDPLKFHYISHTALDIIEEKIAAQKKNTAVPADMYLSLLFPTEVYKMYEKNFLLLFVSYGYVSNSNTKFILTTDESEAKDADIKTFFQKIHSLYVDTICNPFYTLEQQLESKSFEEKLQQAIAQFHAKFK